MRWIHMLDAPEGEEEEGGGKGTHLLEALVLEKEGEEEGRREVEK